ncbi:hypothetical protein CONCODRAFT_14257 [Conidiobolus coronatus NRRL 28638]|uniref:GST N-terminal domain-containing protein n=1 Tax=Conidiobolus coronatus (strain ATCC 28846 / CBS 209.66 / NRRL 28638) TaxID=796925 RepID=A0A137NPC6_CONC2|nr:hypothetical protein CONCODRAFT_14257 [Conidiobolus coronatus NRRL 28638]|eukprot:KXN64588.1 hypothetical protein CONCODRAFT_14257 [Conidiobolus coronatus NRRL 28638]
MTQVYSLLTQVNDRGVSYSPFVIWAELFLRHKGIEYTTVPLAFSDVGPTIKKLTNDKWALVPTIKFDNGDIVYDSFPICAYLDENYPQNPIRKGSPAEGVVFGFYQSLDLCAYKLIVLDIAKSMDDVNSKHMRETKEAEFGMSLEQYAGNPEANYNKFYESTKLLVPLLTDSPFFEGEKPGFSDYLVIGMTQSVRSINPQVYHKLVHENPNTEISNWANRVDELFGGYLKIRKTL